MDRREYPASHQERADQRKRERDDNEEQVPDLEHLPLLLNHHGMQERGPDQPRHKRGIFHRVPPPVTAPAQFIIGPVAAQEYSRGQADPRKDRPPLGDLDPFLAQPAGEQRRHGKGKRNRKPHVAHVQHRRVHDHGRVLEQRVQVLAVRRGGDQPVEGARKKENQEKEPQDDQAFHADEVRHDGRLGSPMKPHGNRAERGQNEHPQQQRAFVAAPDRGDGVKQGELRIRIGGDVMDGKVASQERIDQRGHAYGQEHKNERQGHAPGADPVRIACPERQTGRHDTEHRKH